MQVIFNNVKYVYMPIYMYHTYVCIPYCSYLSGQTNTAAGLREARDSVFANTATNRAGVDDVILLITDGNANIDSVRYCDL